MARKTKTKSEQGKTTEKKKSEISNGIKKIKMKVIGIGNGGGAIVADIAQNVKRVNCLAANTDKSALRKLARRIKTFQFGQEITGGLGTGMDADLGKLAAEKDTIKIERVLKDCDFCILIACLGGGTGSGAVPVFAQISKKLGNLTYGIFTLPFGFEGGKKLEIAKQSLKDLEPLINAITIIPNERIFKIVDKKVPLKQALSDINKILAFNLEGLIEMIYQPGVINIDFADLKTVLKSYGQLSYLNRVITHGEERAKQARQSILVSQLYPYNIFEAKRLLFNIAGPSDLSISEVSEISQGIFDSVNKGARIIFGVSQKPEKRSIEISLMAVGCEMKEIFLAPSLKPKRKKIPRKKKQVNKEEVKKEKEEGKEIKTEPEDLVAKRKIARPKTRIIKKEVTLDVKKGRVRKNALQIQKAVEELEKEITKQEEIWETPAFLRKQTPNNT